MSELKHFILKIKIKTSSILKFWHKIHYRNILQFSTNGENKFEKNQFLSIVYGKNYHFHQKIVKKNANFINKLWKKLHFIKKKKRKIANFLKWSDMEHCL